ncbi:MAG: DUF370 domain-containing protein [Deltaproteobacteria bacterium]|nr:DUF370 domain-containing protein [Deltaproteobacteria bacterium]
MNGKEKFVPGNGYIHIGYGNLVAAAKVDAILMPGSSPMKRLKRRAAAEARLVDATFGRKTRAIIITDSNHVILSAIAPETLWRRAGGVKDDLEREGA